VSDVVGLSLRDHLGTRHPNDPTLAVHRAALAGTPTVYELRHEGRVYQVHVEPWRAGSDGIVGVLGVALDITGRVRAEAALLRSERTLAEFFEKAEAEFAHMFPCQAIGGATGNLISVGVRQLAKFKDRFGHLRRCIHIHRAGIDQDIAAIACG